MKKYALLLLWSVTCLSTLAQKQAKDLLAEAPDSIFPLLTLNNRLDLIDFIENDFLAKVNNQMDQPVVLHNLTDNYLLLETSEKSVYTIKVLDEQTFCLIQIYQGPVKDSRIRFYQPDWTPLSTEFPLPSIDAFWNPIPDSLQQEMHDIKRMLADIPLVTIEAQEENTDLILHLQLNELPKREREIAQPYIHPLRYQWNNKNRIYVLVNEK